MNYMEQVAKMLGVELDQEFKLKGISKVFKITKDGMYMKTALTDDWLLVNYAIGSILIGDHEVKKTILDQAEKEYLSAIIKLFRDMVTSVIKYKSSIYEYIAIRYRGLEEYIGTVRLPSFKKDTMYKGMEIGKAYSLNELGL